MQATLHSISHELEVKTTCYDVSKTCLIHYNLNQLQEGSFTWSTVIKQIKEAIKYFNSLQKISKRIQFNRRIVLYAKSKSNENSPTYTSTFVHFLVPSAKYYLVLKSIVLKTMF